MTAALCSDPEIVQASVDKWRQAAYLGDMTNTPQTRTRFVDAGWLFDGDFLHRLIDRHGRTLATFEATILKAEQLPGMREDLLDPSFEIIPTTFTFSDGTAMTMLSFANIGAEVTERRVA